MRWDEEDAISMRLKGYQGVGRVALMVNVFSRCLLVEVALLLARNCTRLRTSLLDPWLPHLPNPTNFAKITVEPYREME